MLKLFKEMLYTIYWPTRSSWEPDFASPLQMVLKQNSLLDITKLITCFKITEIWEDFVHFARLEEEGFTYSFSFFYREDEYEFLVKKTFPGDGIIILRRRRNFGWPNKHILDRTTEIISNQILDIECHYV